MSSDFRVETEKSGRIWIIITHGYINNQGGEEIAKAYHRVKEQGADCFLLNLKDSTIVNSIGVSILIELLEETLESKGTMAFCECASIVSKTFQIMGLTQYAKIYATQAEALTSMDL